MILKHLPLLICLVGLVVYLLPLKDAPKVTEGARVALEMGLLAFLLKGMNG